MLGKDRWETVRFQGKVSPPWLMAYLRSEAKLSGPWIFQKHSCLITVHLIRVIKSLRHWSCCCGKSQNEIGSVSWMENIKAPPAPYLGLHLKGELGEHNAHWKANGRNQLMVRIIFKMDINCTNAFDFFKRVLKAFQSTMPDMNYEREKSRTCNRSTEQNFFLALQLSSRLALSLTNADIGNF